RLKNRKFLALPKTAAFSHEEGGEKKLPGHRTDEKLRNVFAERWNDLTDAERDQVVEDVLSYEKSDALVRRGINRWGLTTEQAEQLAHKVALEDGFSAHCVPALTQLVAEMDKGTPYSTARKKLFPESFEAHEVYDELPPLSKVSKFRDLRNPAVIRALTELRKVVNTVIRNHGKPDVIRIELARHLKKPRKVRKDISDRNRENQRERDAAKAAIIAEGRIPDPKPVDIEKYRLADECHWICPYTGRNITIPSLFGPTPQFDIEHILPLSRSLDNTFFNKTLCDIEENRNRKAKRTPYEAYAGDEQRYHEILERVSRFSGRARAEKLRRFKMEEIPEGFTLRQLTDTAYASRLAAEYVGLLYGGPVDADGRRRVQVSAGGVTHHLRNVLMLNAVLPSLPDSPAHRAPEDVSLSEKLRVDHRHHAVDAVAIALATPDMVKRLADAAQRAEREGARRPFLALKDPWPGFLEDVRNAIDKVVVSHRVDRRLAGALHEETNYSKPHRAVRKTSAKTELVEYRHVRKPLKDMSVSEVARIVDPVVRQLVEASLAQTGADPKKAFASDDNLPYHTTRDGNRIPIRKARIRKRTNIIQVADGPRRRWVAPGSNHHMEIVAVLDKDGNPQKWEGHLVSRFEAVQRKKRGQHIYQRDFGEGKRFEFSLAPGEMIDVESDKFGRGPFVVRGITGQRIYFARHHDARLKADIIKAGDWFRPSVGTLMTQACRKIRVDYLGKVSPAND
ncbi:MAG: type II CRISPR RNA-guided endonuclease Cas9, partial [Phycisphaerae bacterium]